MSKIRESVEQNTSCNSCFVSTLIKHVLKPKPMVKNTVCHLDTHSNALSFRTHLPMCFADGFLIFLLHSNALQGLRLKSTNKTPKISVY